MYKIKPFLIPLIVIFAALIYYFFSFLIPFTDNAFSVNNITPVSADVSGYITKIYVKNEQVVRQGDPLLVVFQQPYKLAYHALVEELSSAKSQYITLHQKLKKDQELYTQYDQEYKKSVLNYQRNQAALQYGAVSELDVRDMEYDAKSNLAKTQAQSQQIKIDQQDIITQQHLIQDISYKTQKAQVYLKETLVKAKTNGVITNMYLSLGTPVITHQPLFSFIDISNTFIQANFSELDLRKVKAGDNVYIIPRMYFGNKIYHGKIISKEWAANRQITDPRTQIQQVTNNENNWVVFPQRFPVQIKITDYDHKNYPLPLGSSCYVFVSI